jgi:hypothetical protein
VVAVTRDRRSAVLVLLAGLACIAVAQRVAPVATPPLFDGVTVIEPYRWLVPPKGEPGDPTSANDTAHPQQGHSPTVIVATSESPPQAQMFAAPSELSLPPGTTRFDMSIEPILPTAVPAHGHISGNVYRVTLVNQDGAALKPVKGSLVTVVIRGPERQAVTRAQIAQFTGDAWKILETEDAGLPGTYLAVVSSFGDFALIAPGEGGPYPTATPVGIPSSAPTPVGSTAASPSPTRSPTPKPTPVPSKPSTPDPSPTPGLPSGSTDPGFGAPILLAVAGLLLATGITVMVVRRRRREPYF